MSGSKVQQLAEVSIASPQKRRRSSKPEQGLRVTQDTEPSIDYSKTQSKLNPQRCEAIKFQPSNWEKLLMLPFFCFYGCCNSVTSHCDINIEAKHLRLEIYPGILSCLSKTYIIPFSDVLCTKIEMMYNYRINKRQAFTLVLETRFGEFTLTSPKVRAEIKQAKLSLDERLAMNGVSILDTSI